MYLMTCTRPDLAYPLSLLARYMAPVHRAWGSCLEDRVHSEAEIYVGAMAAQELRWLTYLLTDLGERPCSTPVLYVDNKAMIALYQDQRLEHRTKHIALRYFLTRELQQRGQLCLAYVATRANTADVFTKALGFLASPAPPPPPSPTAAATAEGGGCCSATYSQATTGVILFYFRSPAFLRVVRSAMASAAASSLSVNRAVAAAGVCGGEHRRSVRTFFTTSGPFSFKSHRKPLPRSLILRCHAFLLDNSSTRAGFHSIDLSIHRATSAHTASVPPIVLSPIPKAARSKFFHRHSRSPFFSLPPPRCPVLHPPPLPLFLPPSPPLPPQLAASPRASLRLSAPLRASPLPLAPSKCRPLRAPLPSRRPTVRAAAAAPAAMADGGLLTRVAVAAYSALVPAGTAASMGLTELTVVLAVRETIIALATAAIFFNAPKICRLVNYVWGTLIMRDDEVTEEEFHDSMFGALVGPLQFVLISFFLTRHLRLLVPLLKLPMTAAMVGKARAVAWVAAATWFATGWKDRVLKLVAASHPEEKPVLANVSKLLTLLLRVAAVGTLAEMMGFSLKSLIAVGGISGVAIGFASKEIVTNFFGGLILFLTQPFVVGDKIKAGSVTGRVREIGFLQTKLEADDNSPIVVPNYIFNTAVVTNYSRAGCLALEATFVLRNEDIIRIRPITEKLTAYLRAHPLVDVSKGPTLGYLKKLSGTGLEVGIIAYVQDMNEYCTTCLHPFPSLYRSPPLSTPLPPLHQEDDEYLAVQQEILEQSVEIIVEEGAYLGESAPFEPSVSLAA
ncbi:unnamed protein product [Closterium sp. NIES-53]